MASKDHQYDASIWHSAVCWGRYHWPFRHSLLKPIDIFPARGEIKLMRASVGYKMIGFVAGFAADISMDDAHENLAGDEDIV